MAIRATLVALLFACQSAPAAAPPPEPVAKGDATRLPAGTATQAAPGKETTSPTSQGQEGAPACLDQELAKRGLDQYGGEQGTMYPGGTPLFQESTGKRLDRAQYVFARHPDIAAACGVSDAGH